jgi:hypothetical protein
MWQVKWIVLGISQETFELLEQRNVIRLIFLSFKLCCFFAKNQNGGLHKNKTLNSFSVSSYMLKYIQSSNESKPHFKYHLRCLPTKKICQFRASKLLEH